MVVLRKLNCSELNDAHVLDLFWRFCLPKSGSAQRVGYTTPTTFYALCAPFRYSTTKIVNLGFEINVSLHFWLNFGLVLVLSTQLCWRQGYQIVTIIIGFTDENIRGAINKLLLLFQNHPT